MAAGRKLHHELSAAQASKTYGFGQTESDITTLHSSSDVLHAKVRNLYQSSGAHCFPARQSTWCFSSLFWTLFTAWLSHR